MKPGIYSNAELSNDDYHSGPGVSSTTLKELISRSPAHCLAMMEGLRRKFSEAMSLGTVIHSAVLEPETFDSLYWLAPLRSEYPDALETVPEMKAAAALHGVNIKGKTKKDDIRAALMEAEAPVVFWDDLKSAPEGKQVITQAQAEAAAGAVTSIEADPDASFYLSGGVAEQSFVWFDRATGELCKVRTDYYRESDGVLVDLKTCEDARPSAVARAIANYGYDVSAAMYMDGVAACGKPANAFVWVFVETTAPYAVRCYQASEALLSRAREKYHGGLEQFSFCREAENWPAYPGGLVEIDLPVFARGNSETEGVV